MSDQSKYLNALVTANTKVFIYLISGIKLVGVITFYDADTITLNNDFSLQLVYKQAISTIIPA